MNLAKYYPELLTSQIGGFYDPKRKYLVMIKQGDANGLAKQIGQGMADKMDEVVMVHEMTHSLQDQHFNLVTYNIEKTHQR